MKQQEMQFYQKGKLVMNKIYGYMVSYFVLSLAIVNGQNDINKLSNNLIKDIVSKDTLLSEINKKSIITTFLKYEKPLADTTEYFLSIRKQKLYLGAKKDNASLKYFLEEALQDNDYKILSSINKKQIRLVIAKIDSIKHHSFSDVFENIYIVEKPYNNNPIHYFSSAFKIEDNRYLILHVKYTSSLDSYGELYVYKFKENGDYFIEKSILLYIS